MERLMKLVRLYRVANSSAEFSWDNLAYITGHLQLTDSQLYRVTRSRNLTRRCQWADKNVSLAKKLFKDLTDGYL